MNPPWPPDACDDALAGRSGNEVVLQCGGYGILVFSLWWLSEPRLTRRMACQHLSFCSRNALWHDIPISKSCLTHLTTRWWPAPALQPCHSEMGMVFWSSASEGWLCEPRSVSGMVCQHLIHHTIRTLIYGEYSMSSDCMVKCMYGISTA